MSEVLEPGRIGSIMCRNRVVRSATFDYMGNLDKSVSEEQLKLNKVLAAGHVGLIITCMVSVSPEGKNAPMMNGLYDDCFLEGHKKLTETVHAEGGKVVCQINHCGAASDEAPRLSPSGVPSPYTRGAEAVPMTVEDITRITADFASAAVRAKEAGYDGVQLHLAHGYLLSQFINPLYNKRTDQYGGSLENRFRFAKEVITAVKEAVGPEFSVSIKINSNLEEGDETFAPDFLTIGKECKALGIDFIEVSGCDFTPRGRQGLHNYYLERAALLRKEIGIPVVLVGGVRTAEDMDQVLEAGVDAVSMCRPFISEPDLVLKLEQGGASRCVSCSKCFGLALKYTPGAPRCILDVKKD